MEQAGLVERSPAPEDDRGVIVTITDAGRARLTQALPGHIDVLRAQLFTPLSVKNIATLAALLEPVLDHMRAIPTRAPRRRRTRSSDA
jgi:DNA-binding MarR family transcriptional regulator